MEITSLLNELTKEGVTADDLDKVTSNMQFDDLEVPASISIENTLTEINNITKRLYELHNKRKTDPIVLNRIVALVELKTRMLGLMNIKPEVQDIIDSEINTYKKRFIELANLCIDPLSMEVLTSKLAAEGL